MDNCPVFVACQYRNTGKLDIGARARPPLDILLSVELHYFRIFGFLLAVKLFSLSCYWCAAATFRTVPLTILDESRAEAPIGTI